MYVLQSLSTRYIVLLILKLPRLLKVYIYIYISLSLSILREIIIKINSNHDNVSNIYVLWEGWGKKEEEGLDGIGKRRY